MTRGSPSIVLPWGMHLPSPWPRAIACLPWTSFSPFVKYGGWALVVFNKSYLEVAWFENPSAGPEFHSASFWPEGARRAMVKCECIGAAWGGTCPLSGSTLRGLTRGLKGTQESAGLTAPRVVQTKVLLSNVSISVTSTLNPVCAVCLCSLGP